MIVLRISIELVQTISKGCGLGRDGLFDTTRETDVFERWGE
jgi:hypothetical protein